MYKNHIIKITASLFAIATVFNMGLLNFNTQSDATLEAISVMTQAQSEATIGRICMNLYNYCSYDDGFVINGFFIN